MERKHPHRTQGKASASPSRQTPLNLHARQILDSRGNPTIEVEAHTPKGISIGHAPAGASKGSHEALERRDGAKAYGGKGVLSNVKLVNTLVRKALPYLPNKWFQADLALLELNGPKNILGGNTTTAVSIACAKAQALEAGKTFHQWLAQELDPKKTSPGKLTLPVPFFNIINGGEHAGNNLAFQEYMLAPVGAKSFSEALEIGSTVYHALKGVLKEKYGVAATNVGDEGGFAPPETDVSKPLELIMQAAEEVGFGKKVALGMDAAATTFHQNGSYKIAGKHLASPKLSKFYLELADSYPIASIEDPFAEEDWPAFSEFTREAGSKLQVVGDDLLCTNAGLVAKGVEAGACNALLLKVNQAGTLYGAIQAASLALGNKWGVMASHRSGETEDPFIAELVVGLGAGQLKSGAPARGERTAKYNQLLRIEEMLGSKGVYAGRNFRHPKTG